MYFGGHRHDAKGADTGVEHVLVAALACRRRRLLLWSMVDWRHDDGDDGFDGRGRPTHSRALLYNSGLVFLMRPWGHSHVPRRGVSQVVALSACVCHPCAGPCGPSLSPWAICARLGVEHGFVSDDVVKAATEVLMMLTVAHLSHPPTPTQPTKVQVAEVVCRLAGCRRTSNQSINHSTGHLVSTSSVCAAPLRTSEPPNRPPPARACPDPPFEFAQTLSEGTLCAQGVLSHVLRLPEETRRASECPLNRQRVGDIRKGKSRQANDNGPNQ